MSKTELDDVLRWGTEELFKDEEQQDGQGKSTEQNIVWDDNAVDKLLERIEEQQPPQPVEKPPEEGERKDWANEYLSSFKVATYTTKEDEPEEEEDETEVIKEDVQEADPDYWEKLLRHHYEQDSEITRAALGKGKRVRKQVNYATEAIQQEWQPGGAAPLGVNLKIFLIDDLWVSCIFQQDQEYSDSYSGGSDLDGTGSEDEHYDSAREERRRKRERGDGEKLPPLLARVNGQLEVIPS
jgi:hypothetical protein